MTTELTTSEILDRIKELLKTPTDENLLMAKLYLSELELDIKMLDRMNRRG